MATFEDVKRLAALLPEAVESRSYGTPAVSVRGKAFCRQWSEREHQRDGVRDTEVLVVFCNLHERPALIESAEGVLFSSPHYEHYGAMLIRLRDVNLDDLADYLEGSYRRKAPASLCKTLGGP